MADTQVQSDLASGAVVMEGSDFAALLKKEFKPKTDEAKDAVSVAVQTLAQQALAQTKLISDDVVKSIEAIIAELDRKLTEQINQILHHADFQKLEGAWRGLHYLVNNTETDEQLKIRVMNISKADLGKTLKRYKGTPGTRARCSRRSTRRSTASSAASPSAAWWATITSTTHRPTSNCWRDRQVAAGALPVHRGAGSALMQMDSWQELANPRDLTKIFQHARLRRLAFAARDSDDARYIGLAMPRFLARLPYGAKTSPVEEFDFEEDTGAATTAASTPGPTRPMRWRRTSPRVQDVRLVFPDPRHRIRWCGREPAGAHLPDRRRRGRHEVPDRDRDPIAARPNWPRTASCRWCTARTRISPPSSARSRCTSRPSTTIPTQRPTPTWGRGCRTCSPDLPIRALPEVHRARQDRFVQGARRHAALAQRLDPELRRRRSAHSSDETKAKRPLAAPRSWSRKSRAIRATTPRSSSCALAALSARGPDGVPASGFQTARSRPGTSRRTRLPAECRSGWRELLCAFAAICGCRNESRRHGAARTR
jgi:hypothetical protein